MKKRSHNENLNSLVGLLEEKLSKEKKVNRSRAICKGVIYTRVSSKEQADNNGSLEVQLKQCKEYAERNNIHIKECFGGTYDSAKTDGRKEFQHMLSYVKKDKEIKFIIVWNYERFSRTGAGAMQLSNSLRKEGVFIRSITEELDTTTASGRMMENFHHIKNFWDNDSKSERTAKMTKEVMLKGYWPYMVPMGYKNLKPKHRACYHQYIITEEGKLLKKAFLWKAQGVMTNKQIVDKLASHGLQLTEKNFNWVIGNVFYTGYITGRLVDGKLIKGHHPAIIDLKTFLKANNLISTSPKAGIPKCPQHDQLPLKVFMRDEISGKQFTGYIKKGIWYYKTRGMGTHINVNAQKVNDAFKEFLQVFEYKKSHQKTLKELLIKNFKNSVSETLNEATALKKQITEKENFLEKLEERYITGEIPQDLFNKYRLKYQQELEKIRQELAGKDFNSSNLNLTVEKMLAIASNLSQTWSSMDFTNKQRLQYLIFPEGIMYNKENDQVRTNRINSLFAAIPPQKRPLEEKKKGNSAKNCLKSCFVPSTGFEPIHPHSA